MKAKKSFLTTSKNTGLKKKKRIVFITISVSSYNTPFFNELYSRIKEKADIYILYYAKSERKIPETLHKNIKTIGMEEINPLNSKITRAIIKSPDSIIKYFFWYKNLNKTLEEINPDLIQTFLYFMPYSMQAARYAKKNKIPIIIYEESQREPYFILTKTLNRMALFFLKRLMIKNIKCLISPTEQGVEFQKKKIAYKNDVFHVPWPVDENEFLELKRSPHNKKGKIRLLVVARMVPYKKYDTVLDAMNILKKENTDFSLTIIGNGPLENEIKEKIKTYGLQTNINIVSSVDFEKMKSYYSSSDMVILASVYEAYGMIIPESMACGCGVLVSDTSGIKFMVDEGKNGYIFKTGNPEDLAEKITKSVKKTEIFGEHSRLLMKTKYSKKTIIQNYLKLLKREGL